MCLKDFLQVRYINEKNKILSFDESEGGCGYHTQQNQNCFYINMKSLKSYTCIPPTPITNNSCPINNDASKLNKAVPAKDRRSENRLKIEKFHEIVKRFYKLIIKVAPITLHNLI